MTEKTPDTATRNKRLARRLVLMTAGMGGFAYASVPLYDLFCRTTGFGGTPLMELYLMVNSVRKILAGKGIIVARSLTGSYVTSLEMAGCSITITALDDEITALWDAPVHTAALRW